MTPDQVGRWLPASKHTVLRVMGFDLRDWLGGREPDDPEDAEQLKLPDPCRGTIGAEPCFWSNANEHGGA